MLALSFTDEISNTKTKINFWNSRSLTPMGRITVIFKVRKRTVLITYSFHCPTLMKTAERPK